MRQKRTDSDEGGLKKTNIRKTNMASQDQEIVVGIDVGGKNKGFHAVALIGRKIKDKKDGDLATILQWLKQYKIKAIAVDAPCKWSVRDNLRQAEKDP